MAKHSANSGGGSNGKSVEPPCVGAGDDRAGPERPPWAIPVHVDDGRGPLAASDRDFYGKYPTLHDFLTLTGWGGKGREAGSVTLFAQDGKFKAVVNDKDGGNIAFVSGDSVAGLLEAMDKGLKGGHLDWRANKFKKR